MVLTERFPGGAPTLCTLGQFESKNSSITRVNYQMINRKCNCENEVSSQKLAVLKKASSGKVALAKTFV